MVEATLGLLDVLCGFKDFVLPVNYSINLLCDFFQTLQSGAEFSTDHSSDHLFKDMVVPRLI